MEDFSGYSFKEIKYQEDINKVIHRHWFDILQQFFVLGIFIIVLTGGFFISPVVASFFDNQDSQRLFLFVENTLLIFSVIYAAFIWIDYYFDVWVITNRRIVNIEQKGLFVRHVSELTIERVQDVTVEVKGFIPTMLNFGDVYVQTAAEKERFVFRMVPNPYGIKDLIMNLQKEVEREETNEMGEVIRKQVHKDNY